MIVKDFKLSADGDLVLGEQAVDSDGYLLYYALYPGEEQSFITRTPSDYTRPMRDIKIVEDDEGDLQLIKSRLQTENPDWRLYPLVGADLTDLIGLPNTPETAYLAEQSVLRALTYDGAFKEKDLTINVVPVSAFTLFIDIKLRQGNQLIRYSGSINLELGVWNEYQLPNPYEEENHATT